MGAAQQPTTVVVVGDEGRQVAVWQLVAPVPPDLGLVEVLALLQVAVRRRGWVIVLRDPGDRLRELVDLVGLGDLLGCPAPGRSGLEAGGEPEGFEELGVQEVVEPRDAPL